MALLRGKYCAALPRTVAARDQQYEAEATPTVPTFVDVDVASHSIQATEQVPVSWAGPSDVGRERDLLVHPCLLPHYAFKVGWHKCSFLIPDPGSSVWGIAVAPVL